MSDKSINLIDIREDQEALMKIARNAAIALERENKIAIAPAEASLTIAYQVIAATIEYVASKREKGANVSLNFMQLFDVGISHREADEDEAEKDGNFVPFINPGQEMKLRAKNDAETEEE